MRQIQFLLTTMLLIAFIVAGTAAAATQNELNKNPKFFDPGEANHSQPDWKFGFRVGGFYSFADHNKYNHDLKNGTGYDFDFIYNASTLGAFRFSFGKSGLSIANIDYRTHTPVKVGPGGYGFKPATPPLPPNLTYIYNGAKMDLTQYFVLFQINLIPPQHAVKNFNAYFITGLGLLHYDTNLKYDIFDSDTGTLFHYSREGSENRLGFQFGLGMTLLVYNNLGFDLSAQNVYNSKSEGMTTDGYSSSVPDYSSTIDIRLGMIVAF